MELFERDPEKAKEWAEGDYKQFTPAKVRDALGLPEDRIYKFRA